MLYFLQQQMLFLVALHFSFNAHTESLHHINQGSPVCVMLTKTRCEEFLCTGRLFLQGHFRKIRVVYLGDNNQQSHSAVL